MIWQHADNTLWPRAIILVDMNSFFASVEQLDHPEWQGRALAVTNGAQGSCIITSSYEARAYGIKTGMRLREAKKLCQHLIQVPARPKRYAEVSRKIMQALEALSPDSEMPLGGWARLANIKSENNKWNMYLPKAVRIPVNKFMEKNFEGKSCWYEVTKGKCVQGLLAQIDHEYRLYIVTIDPEDLMNCHYRWPNIIVAEVKCV